MTLRRALVELTVTEQRYRAMLEAQAGSTVTDVAARRGVPAGGASMVHLVCRGQR